MIEAGFAGTEGAEGFVGAAGAEGFVGAAGTDGFVGAAGFVGFVAQPFLEVGVGETLTRNAMRCFDI